MALVSLAVIKRIEWLTHQSGQLAMMNYVVHGADSESQTLSREKFETA